MRDQISFILDGELLHLKCDGTSGLTPTTTVLQFLRSLPGHRGAKEGCGRGDCGACTVVVGDPDATGRMLYAAVNSCLLYLPMLHGRHLLTVENLKDGQGTLHPVQSALVENFGSQCGFCTPGVAMSMFALYKSVERVNRDEVREALTGNLCRCTGYQPILDAALQACSLGPRDHFSAAEARVASLLRPIRSESLHLENASQRYFRPVTLVEALVYKRARPRTVVVAGGTDAAAAAVNEGRSIPDILDVSGIEELRGVTGEKGVLRIGAAAPLTLVSRKSRKDFPALDSTLAYFGSRQIRNVASLGGNIATASPIGDSLPVLLACDAEVVLESMRQRRKVPLADVLAGYRKAAMADDELITEIVLPGLDGSVTVKSYKISRRGDVDIATVSAAFRLERDPNNIVASLRAVYGGMAEMVRRAFRTEEFAAGKEWSRNTVEQAMTVLDREFTPISDVRGSAALRRVAARNLLMKFWADTSRAVPGDFPEVPA